VAIQCVRCGQELPRDDARFCNNCGMAVTELSFKPQSLTAHEKREEKRELPEQIAQQPEPRSTAQRRLKDQALAEENQLPVWLSNLDKREQGKSSLSRRLVEPPKTPILESQDEDNTVEEKGAEKKQPGPIVETNAEEKIAEHETLARPAPLTLADASAKKENPTPLPPENPLSSNPAQPPKTMRELRVKVWEQAETVLLNAREEQGRVNEKEVEEFPTRPMTSLSEGASARSTVPPTPALQERDEDIEKLDTVTMPAQEKPVFPKNVAPPSLPPRQEKRVSSPPEQDDRTIHLSREVQRRLSQPGMAVPAQERKGVSPSVKAAQGQQSVPPSLIASPPSSARPRRSRSIIVLIILVPLIVLGSLGAWLVVAQPFTISPVTQPWQSFKDEQLGISLQYPSGWQKQVERQKATVHLFDSSRTAQVNITVTDATGGDAAQLLAAQAKQVNMTKAQTLAPVSFGKASWQQIRGTVQQDGASYTETIFATIHNNRLFMFAQLAPQSTYADEESILFAPMRASWQFL
jgi:hypothetical protein